MDINLTGYLWGMPFNLSGTAYQSLIYIIIGGIAGALISGILKLLGDWLNRKMDRQDYKNRLIGQLIGQKHFILQLYAFYFYSFISHEYLMLRSTVEGIHGIDYDFILNSIPPGRQSNEAMKMANKARLESVEYKDIQEEAKNIEEIKLKLARGIKDLFIIIGSLQAHYLDDLKKNEFIKDIENAMDNYNKLELMILDKINRKQENILNIAGVIPSQANARGLEPNVWRDQYFYEWIKETDDLSKELKRERHIRSENLEGKINDLINYFVYNDLKKARWYQFWKIHIQEKAQP